MLTITEVDPPRTYDDSWPEGLPDDGIDASCQMVPCAGSWIGRDRNPHPASIAAEIGDAETPNRWHYVWKVTEGDRVSFVCEDCAECCRNPQDWDGTPEEGRPEFDADGVLRWVKP